MPDNPAPPGAWAHTALVVVILAGFTIAAPLVGLIAITGVLTVRAYVACYRLPSVPRIVMALVATLVAAAVSASLIGSYLTR